MEAACLWVYQPMSEASIFFHIVAVTGGPVKVLICILSLCRAGDFGYFLVTPTTEPQVRSWSGLMSPAPPTTQAYPEVKEDSKETSAPHTGVRTQVPVSSIPPRLPHVSACFASKGTDYVYSQLSFQECLHSGQAWKIEIASPSKTKGRFAYSLTVSLYSKHTHSPLWKLGFLKLRVLCNTTHCICRCTWPSLHCPLGIEVENLVQKCKYPDDYSCYV